jgi:hypothetical protein
LTDDPWRSCSCLGTEGARVVRPRWEIGLGNVVFAGSEGFYLPTPTANTHPANANRSVSVATAPTDAPVANSADTDATAIVGSRRIPVAIACIPASCSLGTPQRKKRRGDDEGGGYCSYTHLIAPFRYDLYKYRLLGREALRGNHENVLGSTGRAYRPPPHAGGASSGRGPLLRPRLNAWPARLPRATAWGNPPARRPACALPLVPQRCSRRGRGRR